MERLFEIVAEDEQFLVINKPAGLVCHPTKGDVYSSLISRVRLYLGEGSSPHMVNRLDRETSGIVIIAKEAETASRIRKLWEGREVEKEYLAIVHGRVPAGKTVINAPLGKDPNSMIAIKDTVLPDGAPSETHAYGLHQVAYDGRELSLVRVVLMTGRKHQIRIHFSHIGHPIVGDKLYGGDENVYLRFVEERLTEEDRLQLITENHALHAKRVTFNWFGSRRTYSAFAEDWFRELARAK